ncbi:hypothetical protein HMPREF0724_12618 [Prescottella equi ATCC 33707]|uniref:Uncharacterized protein n=1 Tax=Prescottella equi ATCC 33707 TaxID=525370 RepID=E9T241_RHOHA|nr:hypothetical protein HMPREF0724_12618 [Prescottella equi ATCC 33707]
MRSRGSAALIAADRRLGPADLSLLCNAEPTGVDDHPVARRRHRMPPLSFRGHLSMCTA